MNRVIKFRGLCSQSKEMVYGDIIHGVGYKQGNIYILPNNTNLAYVKHCDPLDGVNVFPETVGQFTGFKDSGGTELYEGDVIENDGVGYKIEWCESSGCWDCIDSEVNNINLCQLASSKETWFQGNIHENPEILNNPNT